MSRRGPRLHVKPSEAFEADYVRCAVRGDNTEHLDRLIEILTDGRRPPKGFQPHPVHTDFPGMVEGHITPDFLLVYRIEGRTLHLHRCGSHRELFPRSKHARV